MKDKLAIVIVSPEAWGASFVSKHHYAYHLAKVGHHVLFINPPRPVVGTFSVQIAEISVNLLQCTHTLLRGLNHLPPRLKRWYLRQVARSIIAKWGRRPDLIWNFDPYQFQDPTVFGPSVRSIYHAVDIHQTHLENECVRGYQRVFGSSGPIVQKLRSLGAAQAEKVNHGLAEWFCEHPAKPASLPREYAVSIGYVGNMLYPYLDYEVLYDIICQHPDIGFFFIGPDGTSNLGTTSEGLEEKHVWVDRIRQLSNTHFLGVLPSKELPSYLAVFDAFLMTYKAEEYPAELANPHKILEYLSSGKVVVAHLIDEYKDKGQLVEMASRSELPSRFSEVTSRLNHYNGPDRQKNRMAFASANVYESHIDHILNKTFSEAVTGNGHE